MGVHRFAVATAAVTFLLLIAGGLVSTTESGLACPDWPLCEGKYFPEMRDGKEYEHSHRLIASFVGAMTFGLCALIFKHRRQDRLLKGLGLVAVGLVVVQALLGALTVWLRLPPWTSSSHLAVGMAFFALTVTLAFLTRQREALVAPGIEVARRPTVIRLWAVAIGLLYLQIVGGAVMRHVSGGLACGHALLTCMGEVWPAHPFIGVHAHLAHRYLGVISGLAVIAFSVVLFRAAQSGRLRALAVSLGAGVAAQVGLGVWTVLSTRQLHVVNTHSTVAALLLAGMVAAYWLISPSRAPRAAEDALPAGSAQLGVA